MRPPSMPDSGPLRPRQQSTDLTQASSEPITLILARESELSNVSTRSSTTSAHDQGPWGTLKQTIEEANRITGSPTNKTTNGGRGHSRRRSTVIPRSVEGLRQEALRCNPPPPVPPPHFALRIGNPSLPPSLEPSLPSSPKSLSERSIPRSDDCLTQDETNSQAIETDDEEGDPFTSSVENSAPQLIMPSIHMPSRRPFTSRGERLGRLKIMVAGPQGSGKTSLIKSIVQSCDDIVHIDPVPTSDFARTHQTSSGISTAPHCTEVYASSRPYPKWWNNLDDSRMWKRRKSLGDQVLNRNICFVDAQTHKTTARLEQYMVDQLLNTINCASQSIAELVGLMTGRGGNQVDLVLYLITQATIEQDIKHIRKLSDMSNVVPVIAKSDQLAPEQITELKQAIPHDICAIPQLPINFGSAVGLPATAQAPYTISSISGPDFDNMDASLLMSSEYVQPLLPSELSLLVNQIFEPENAAFLRHVAAKKLVTWYNSTSNTHRSVSPSIAASPISIPPSPLPQSLSASGILVPLTSELSLNTSNDLSVAYPADDTQKVERLAQVRLSKWASDLQQSMQRERNRLHGMTPNGRAFWASETVNQDLQQGHILPISEDQRSLMRGSVSEKGRILRTSDGSIYQIHDPLGVMAWRDVLRQQGWLTLQLVGAFGVMSGLAIWIARTWRMDEMVGEWLFGKWVD